MYIRNLVGWGRVVVVNLDLNMNIAVLVKILSYVLLLVGAGLLWFGGFLYGGIGVLVVFFLLFLSDWNDWRLRRFFSYDFLFDRREVGEFADKDVRRDLNVVLRLGDEMNELLYRIEDEDLLSLEKEASLGQKDRLTNLYRDLDEKLEVVNELFWKYSGRVDMKREKGKEVYFVHTAAFVYMYDVGSRMSVASNFVVYLLLLESETYKNLIRSLVFPSTQVFLRSGLYVLKKLKFRSEKINKKKDKFVKDMKYSVGLSRFPYLASFKYYFSLVKLFKTQHLVPLLKSFLLFIDEKKVREGGVCMTVSDVEKVMDVLEPGDIIVQRRALSMSSWVIPGYWTHGALYVGGREELKEYFGVDAVGVLNKLDKLKLFGKTKYVFEAIKEGVSASDALKVLKADSIVVFKPKVGEFDRLRAAEYVLGQLEKEYDYGLDFLSEKSFICSELVYKAYSDVDSGENLLGFEPRMIGGLVFTFTPEDLYESCVAGLGDRFEVGICLKHDKNYKKVREVEL